MKTVLFIGNSFVYYNDLPAMVQQISGGELVCGSVTKGGAFAHQYADPDHELGARVRQTLQSGKWDCVVLQDQSCNPAKDPADCLTAMAVLSALTGDAQRFFYQTWAYRDGSKKLHSSGMDYETMYGKLKQTYAAAALENNGTLVPVGDGFRQVKLQHPQIDLYNADNFHPSPAGTYLAACIFCGMLMGADAETLSDIPELDHNICAKLRAVAKVVSS